jgi:hypothetical protein
MTKAQEAFVKRRIRRGTAELKEQFERFVKATTFAYGFNQPCTRQAPHICKVNGPCNGMPRTPIDTGRHLTWHEAREKNLPLEHLLRVLDEQD